MDDDELKEAAQEMHSLMSKGKLVEAFDKFYSDDVSMQENNTPPTTGKIANRNKQQQLIDSIDKFNSLKIHNVAFGKDLVISEYTLDLTMKNGEKAQWNEVSVQKWKDGKVILEKFYYKP